MQIECHLAAKNIVVAYQLDIIDIINQFGLPVISCLP